MGVGSNLARPVKNKMWGTGIPWDYGGANGTRVGAVNWWFTTGPGTGLELVVHWTRWFISVKPGQ